MKKEIAIVSVNNGSVSIITQDNEPEVIKLHINWSMTRHYIDTQLRDVLSRLYNEGYTIETSNSFSVGGVETYVLVRDNKI